MDEKQKRTPPKGRVITFYSYKGGTGRSMALANVAWLLAMNGERVLVVDWDLEAPGIHRYFHPLLEDRELLETEGLLDFVEKLSTRAAMSANPLNEEEIDIIEYVTILKWPANSPVSWEKFGSNAGIDLLVAGRQGPLYGKRLNAFSFVDLYEKLGGRRMLRIAREQMRSLYDYVLIDSRTGVSDTSGICTVEMPDTLVVCFTLNDQSIIGASGVANDVLEQRKALLKSPPLPLVRGASPILEPPFRIFPVPTRVEIGGEQGKLQIALDLARKRFAPFLVDHIPREAWSKYWGGVQMAYFPFYAFEEIPAVFGDPPHQQISLLASIKQIARVLSGSESLDLPALADEDEKAEARRKEILGWYLRKPDSSAFDPVVLAQWTYDQADPANQQLIRKVMLRLVQVGGSAPVTAVAEIGDLGKTLEPVARSLADAGVLQIDGSSVSVADRKIVERWERLGLWVKEDEAFLIWRQPFSVAARSWQLSGKDPSGLLRGKFLDQARTWMAKRREDLTEIEREFIQESRRRKQSEIVLFAPSPRTRLIIGVIVIVAALVALFGGRFLEAGKRYFAPSGENWNPLASGTRNDLYSIFGTSDGKRLWAVGDKGTILESSDGEHWNPLTIGPPNALTSIFGTSDGKRLWAVGEKGTILESNGGEYWTALTSGTPSDLFSVFGTSDGKRLWAVGEKGTILESSDGEHWNMLTSGTNNGLYSIFGTSNGKRLWAVGRNGRIVESSDGEYWSALASGTTNVLWGIFGTSDGKRLWAVGTSGTILESSGGEHWNALTSGTTSNLYSVFGTSDGKRLWAVGVAGTILESSDSERWNARNSGTTAWLYSIFGTSDGKRLWAVGQNGTILESHGR